MTTPAQRVTRLRERARPRYRSTATLRQVKPYPGRTLVLALDPVAVTPGAGVGGWQEVTHPKRASSTEWTGTPLRTLTVDLLVDAYRAGDDVEEACRVLDVWGRVQPGHDEPVVVEFSWGRWTPYRWVIQDVSYGDALHDEHGNRTRQAVTVELLEHREAVLGLRPAQRATPTPARNSPGLPSSGPTPTASGRTYTVRAGDTLSRIAQRELGDAARWPELARLNNLRDPDRIQAGQTLRLPA